MEDWQVEFEWLRVRHLVKDAIGFSTLPDMNGVLFMIGIQELGIIQPTFTKEEKQDLMHLAVCRLLSYDGYYEWEGRDADGWPHYKLVSAIPIMGEEAQEKLLQLKIIQYFNDWEQQGDTA